MIYLWNEYESIHGIFESSLTKEEIDITKIHNEVKDMYDDCGYSDFEIAKKLELPDPERYWSSQELTLALMEKRGLCKIIQFERIWA
jgi:hypothetical protein